MNSELILLILCCIPLTLFIAWALIKKSPAEIAKKRVKEVIDEDRKKRRVLEES